MISTHLIDGILLVSLLVSVAAYVFVSKHEGSYFNLLTPSLILSIPAYYFLPWFYIHVFGNENSLYAYIYVYGTLAVENVLFAYVYTRPTRKLLRLAVGYSYSNFGSLSLFFLALAALMYLPILLQFPEYILDPRQLYTQTRTGFGVNFFISSAMAYLAAILVLFSRKSRFVKASVVLLASAILILHGSKGQVLSLALLLVLYAVYVRKHKLKMVPALLSGFGLAVLGLLLFAATMVLGDSPGEMLETISSYSDYTRNAMLVIDSNYPRQYGRLTLESNIIGRIPRALMPSKPKSFGAFRLADQFYPEALDADAGAPDFGVGMEYADFGAFAIVYLAMFAILRGYLARIFVQRLNQSSHPSDFVLVAFFSGISIFPVGGVGWLFPEALASALLLRFLSRLGAPEVYHERLKKRQVPPIPGTVGPVY